MIEPNDNYEREIDRVLAGLRQVEPGTGMEARVLRRLEEREETKASSLWMFRLAWGGGLAVAVVAVAFVMHHSGQRVAPRDVVAHDVASIAVTRSHSVTVAPALMAEGMRQPPVERVQEERNPRPTIEERQAAQTDATAASFPAPPLPLTQQEKLLMRVAHRGEQGPVTPPPSLGLENEVAELRADTDKFFQDPTTGENQWKRIVAQQAPAK